MSQKFKNIALDDLKLDSKNPRLPKSKQGKDEKSIIQWMLMEAATVELMMAIGENDFFAGEQLLVVEHKEQSGKYIVIEGNRRLTAVKLLSNPDLTEKVKREKVNKICEEARFKPEMIPCLIFDDENEILKYLGFRHITGIKSWRLLEKARYLNDLRENEFAESNFLDASREIAKMIGSSSNYIKRLLISFLIYKKIEEEDFYRIEKLNDTKFHLNYLTDGIYKSNIRNFLGVDVNSEKPTENLNEKNLEKIVQWWFEKYEGRSRVIGDSRGLNMLDKVLSSPVALKAFENGHKIEDAYELTGEIDVLFRKSILKSLEKIEEADRYSHKVDTFYSGVIDDLQTIFNLTKKIKSFKAEKELDEDEF